LFARNQTYVKWKPCLICLFIFSNTDFIGINIAGKGAPVCDYKKVAKTWGIILYKPPPIEKMEKNQKTKKHPEDGKPSEGCFFNFKFGTGVSFLPKNSSTAVLAVF